MVPVQLVVKEIAQVLELVGGCHFIVHVLHGQGEENVSWQVFFFMSSSEEDKLCFIRFSCEA